MSLERAERIVEKIKDRYDPNHDIDTGTAPVRNTELELMIAVEILTAQVHELRRRVDALEETLY